MSNLKRNLLKNGFASFLRKIVRVAEQLFLVPFFIASWGAEYYGEWITLTIIPSVIALSDLGFGSAASNSFVLAYAAKEYQKAANIDRTSKYVIFIVVVLVISFSALIIFSLFRLDFLKGSLIPVDDAIISVLILITARSIDFYSQYFTSYYRSARKAALGLNLFALKTLLNLFGGLFVLLMGLNVVAFAISQLIVVVFFNLFFAFKGRFVLGSFFKHYKGVKNKEELKAITNKGFGFLLTPVWQSIYFQGTTLIVRIVLGAESVAVFNTARTLSRSINQIFAMINISVLPELQFEIGSGNFLKAAKLFRISVLSVLIMSVVGSLLLSVFGVGFYELWTNQSLYLPGTMWNIFVLGIIFNSIWFTSGLMFTANNEPYRLSVFGLLYSFISIILTYFLSIHFGIIGATAGSVSLEVLMAVTILPMACKQLNITVFEFCKTGLFDLFSIAKKVFYNLLNTMKWN